ncbi:hypothetical protein GCM10027454_02840 [Algoriphagus aestuariicola]
MKKATIRSIVLLFWAALFVQAGLMFHFKIEPYPTFRFPGFGGKVQTGGIKNFDQYEIYLHSSGKGDSVMYPLDQFLPDISFKKPTLDLIADKYQNDQARTPEKKDFEEWLSKNLAKNIPDKEFSRISILEVQHSYNLETNELKNDRTLINYFNIELNPNE